MPLPVSTPCYVLAVQATSPTSLCDGWRKMLTSLASCANRHKAGPGNIMQPPGTKVGQVGTKLLQTWYQKVYPLVPKSLPPGTKVGRVGTKSSWCQSCEMVPNPAGAINVSSPRHLKFHASQSPAGTDKGSGEAAPPRCFFVASSPRRRPRGWGGNAPPRFSDRASAREHLRACGAAQQHHQALKRFRRIGRIGNRSAGGTTAECHRGHLLGRSSRLVVGARVSSTQIEIVAINSTQRIPYAFEYYQSLNITR
eukprot:COSAG02_NODE_108_length_36286_cov_19.437478_6_plen_253_part_00